jgi:vacuolar protein sorting-associated protein 13A/C
MAKKFVLDALIKVLGEFIDINEENLNLSVAVWSGRIVLNNLKLKTDKLLQSLNLSVHHGLIHQLEVIIPWTALFNSPVKILIDGVYLQFGPLSSHSIPMKDRRKHSLDRKREKLRLSDKFLDYSSVDGGAAKHGRTGRNETYMQQFTTKIIDNLEITLTNVHIRYEDSISVPNRVISAGITLSSFILATCDEHWKVSFIARSSSQSATLNKIAEVKGFAVYWNTVSESFMKLSFDDWVIAMIRCIAVENMTTSIRGLRYILAPKNNITIKLTHREVSTESTPKINIIVECTNLPLSIDMTQYLQLKRVITQVVYEDRGYGKYSFSYRPKLRPNTSRAAAKAWWLYACKAVIRKPRYIDLVKLIKLHEKCSSSPSSSPYDPLTPLQCRELEHLEERLPTHALVLFRLAALKEVAEHKRRQQSLQSPTSRNTAASQQNGTPAHSGWSSWFSSSSVADTPNLEDDVPLDRILEEFHEDTIVNESGVTAESQNQSSALLALLQLNSSATLEVLYESKAVIRSAMSLSASVQITSLGVLAQADLVDFTVEDKFTPSPSLRNLISVKHRLRNRRSNEAADKESSGNTTSKPSSLTLKIEYYRGKMKAKVTTLPFLFCVNKDCVQMLLAMYFYNPFTGTEANTEQDQLASSYQSVAADLSKSKSQGDSFTPQHSDFEVIFEAHAPKIIIPEHSSSDSGYLLLDTGYLEVKGFTGKDGMSWNVSLKDVNVAMPLSVKDLYTFNEKYLYLIKVR